MAKGKVKAKVKTSAKKKPIKAGSQHTNTTGGIFTTKVIAISKKIKDGKSSGKN